MKQAEGNASEGRSKRSWSFDVSLGGLVVAGLTLVVGAVSVFVAYHLGSQQGLDNRLSTMEERIIARMEAHFDDVNRRFDDVDRRFVEAEVREKERFDEVNRHLAQAEVREQERFAEVHRRFDDVDRRFGEVNQHLGKIDDRLGQVDGFFELSRQLEGRIGRLEERFETWLRSRVDPETTEP